MKSNCLILTLPVAATIMMASPGSAAPAIAAIATYEAEYSIEYRGRSAGASQFSVSLNEDDATFRFRSHSKLRGLIARLAAPRPIIEDSTFRLNGAAIEPLAFSYEDGSRKGEDNYRIGFDWPATATLELDEAQRAIDLAPGVLDRGTAQVVLMQKAAAGRMPAGMQIIDDDGLERYEVAALEPAVATTEFGEFQTERYSQQRVGSSRQTIFWLAPELDYLPVRIEQIRNGEAQTIFSLTTVSFTGQSAD